MSDQVLDAEVVPENGSQELVHAGEPRTLFRTDDPAEVLQRAMATANALKPVLLQQGMTQNISGREHVKVEGWTTLGAMLGVTPVCVWTRKLQEPEGWEARVEARTLDGRVIGAAEGQCLKQEPRWREAEDYARRSMAQTRATSKALGSVLRFVVTLAGYAGTPAEEMDGVPPGEREGGASSSGGRKISEAQVKLLGVRSRKAGRKDVDTVALIKARFGVDRLEDLSMSDMDAALELVQDAGATGESDVPADTADLVDADPGPDDDVPFS